MNSHHTQLGIVQRAHDHELRESSAWKGTRAAGHIPLRIFPVVGRGGVGRIWRTPSHIGFGLVGHQSFAVAGNVFVDWLELGIICHDVLAASVLDFHPNVLPYLTATALCEIAIDLVDCISVE